MSTQTHTPTPTPWRLIGADPQQVKRGTFLVANCTKPEDAAHIVKCVNAHDELMAFVLSVAHTLTEGHALGDHARAILAKVQS